MPVKRPLLGKNLEELKEVAASVGLPAYTAGQIASWLYKHKVSEIDEMTNISKAGREALKERFVVGRFLIKECVSSSDGTKKYLFTVNCSHGKKLNEAEYAGEEKLTSSSIETVMIPDNERKTLCVSSQAGCKMGCAFCMTGRQGFHGNLSAADIVAQYLSVDERDSLTNTVFMGMGEPLDNYENVSRAIEILTSDWGFGWSPKRITLSTIGIIPALKRFMDETKCHIAVSLHNPFPEERLAIMPVQKLYPAREVIDLLKKYDFSGQRRVSFEYIMFNGINDDKKCADALIRLFSGLECRVNLIRFHKIPDFEYETSPMIRMEMFRDRLNKAGVTATIRASRGEDIFAACGLLAGKH